MRLGSRDISRHRAAQEKNTKIPKSYEAAQGVAEAMCASHKIPYGSYISIRNASDTSELSIRAIYMLSSVHAPVRCAGFEAVYKVISLLPGSAGGGCRATGSQYCYTYAEALSACH